MRGQRQTIALISNTADQYWLSRHITAKSLRIEISITGEQYLINEISQCLRMNTLKSPNKPKQDGNESISFKIRTSVSNNFNQNSVFLLLYYTINSKHLEYLPPTIKHIRLHMAKGFDTLDRPLLCTSSNVIVHEQCVNWLLAWLIWPIAHKERMYKQ